MCLSVRRLSSRVLLLALALTACHDSTGPTLDQTSARQRWDQRGPASYQLTVTRSCFCPDEVIGPVAIVVANGEVQSRTYVRTGEPVQPMFANDFPDVEGLFDYIGRMQESGTPVDALYDATLGYPVRIAAGADPGRDDFVTTQAELR